MDSIRHGISHEKNVFNCTIYVLSSLSPAQRACTQSILTSPLFIDIITQFISGPGTGIAPMRALLQERKFRCDAEKSTSKNTLYFGCKKRDLDYLYKDEIEDYVSNKTLSSLHLAFSREQQRKVCKLPDLPLNSHMNLISDSSSEHHMNEIFLYL